MASLTQWTWVWVDSRSWWWTGRPGLLQFMWSQRIGHDWATELNWTDHVSKMCSFHLAWGGCWDLKLPTVWHPHAYFVINITWSGGQTSVGKGGERVAKSSSSWQLWDASSVWSHSWKYVISSEAGQEWSVPLRSGQWKWEEWEMELRPHNPRGRDSPHTHPPPSTTEWTTQVHCQPTLQRIPRAPKKCQCPLPTWKSCCLSGGGRSQKEWYWAREQI